MMRQRGLARRFEKPVQRDARRAREAGLDAHADLAARHDLRHLPTFTIDPATARDFDDAISAERLADGRIRVWVHIADVCAHVPPGSLLDREAHQRATSIYVPGAVEPMLPEALSNGACSLLPGHDRLAVTVELELRGADVLRSAFHRSLIRSDMRLDYEQVDRIFAGQERAQEPWGEPLAAARAVSAALADARRRAHREALTLDQAEPEFLFDQHGNVSAIHPRPATESHRLIEHLMIAANEAVARELAQRRIPCLYRVHERPEADKVKRLVAQLASLGVPTPPLPDPLSRTQAAELMGDISRRVERHIQAGARRAHAGQESAAHSGGRGALTVLVLRSLQQAYYSPRNLGHSGLGSACYCHFTSPIRRYPDLVCHRALLSTLGGSETERAPRAGELPQLGVWTSEREREALTIERDGDDIARCFALQRALYEDGFAQVFAGEVTGLISAGSFIAFGHDPDTEMPLYEGMLPVRRLSARGGERDWWELNPEGTILHGQRSGETLRLGDPIAVVVQRVDAARGRVDLSRAP
jgi:ribonuclease R